MNKILKSSLIVLSLLIFAFSSPVFAEEAQITVSDLNVSEPTILPTSPFYFIKDIGRSIQSVFTFDPVKKTELSLKFANEKLAEAQKIANENNDDSAVLNALDKYKDEIIKLEQYAKGLKKDNPANENLLNSLTEQNFNHQKALEQIVKNKATLEQKIEEIKNNAIESITSSTFSIASSEKVKEKIDNIIQNQETKINSLEKALTLKKMQENTADSGNKKALIESQEDLLSEKLEDPNLTTEEKTKIETMIEELKTNKEYREVVIKDVLTEITAGNKDLISQISTALSEEDMNTLKGFAENLLSEDKLNYGNVLSELNKLNISTDAKKLIDIVQEKVINKDNSQELGCIGIDNPVCGIDNKTYANICEAKKAGVDVAYKSKCGECITEGKIINPSISKAKTCCSGLVLCPVSNSTTNNNENVRICKKTCEQEKAEDKIVCTTNWDPVCGENGKTYSNECFLNRAGVKISHKGECTKQEKPVVEKTEEIIKPIVPVKPEPKTESNETSVGLANPASVYCEKQGYKIEIRKDDQGNEYGMCVFEDGKECDEWKFYRKECGEEYIK